MPGGRPAGRVAVGMMRAVAMARVAALYRVPLGGGAAIPGVVAKILKGCALMRARVVMGDTNGAARNACGAEHTNLREISGKCFFLIFYCN